MNYQTALQTISNVTISSRFSPRQSGETAARSQWQEVSLKALSFAERIETIRKAAASNSEVYLKTATGYGRVRLFVKA
jgi:transcriptional regulator of acetoin/glycerol metabolism